MDVRILGVVAIFAVIPACGGDSDRGGTPFVTDPAPVQDNGTALGGSDAPFIRIVAPGPHAKFPAGATVNIKAVALDPDADIVRVDFYDGAIPVGTRLSAPYVIAWGTQTPGTHHLTAVALDITGLTAVSPPVTVFVIEHDRDDAHKTGDRDDDDDDHDDDDDDDDH